MSVMMDEFGPDDEVLVEDDFVVLPDDVDVEEVEYEVDDI